MAAAVLAILGIGAVGPPVAFHPRHAVRLGRGAPLTLFEVAVGAGVYLHNSVLEMAVGDGARLAHLRLQDEAREAFHVSRRTRTSPRAGPTTVLR